MSQQRYTPSHRWVDRSWGRFSGRVKERLAAGIHAYGNRSFSRDPVELVGEINQELLDVAGWAFILFERLKTAEHALKATQPKTKPSMAIAPAQPTAGAGPDGGLHLELAPHEVVMLDALAARLGCSRGDVLRQALHVLFRIEFADRFAADGSVPVITSGGPTNKVLPDSRGNERK